MTRNFRDGKVRYAKRPVSNRHRASDRGFSAEYVNIDETNWRENRQRAWLWVAAVPLVVVFRIARSRDNPRSSLATGFF